MFAFYTVDATQIGLTHSTNPALLEYFTNRVESTNLFRTSTITLSQSVHLFQQNNSANSKTSQQQHINSIQTLNRLLDKCNYLLLIGKNHLGIATYYLFALLTKFTQHCTFIPFRQKHFINVLLVIKLI